jgi:hypothetical protein
VTCFHPAPMGIADVFQTFENLESVKDKQADVKAIRKLLDSEKPKESNNAIYYVSRPAF